MVTASQWGTPFFSSHSMNMPNRMAKKMAASRGAMIDEASCTPARTMNIPATVMTIRVSLSVSRVAVMGRSLEFQYMA